MSKHEQPSFNTENFADIARVDSIGRLRAEDGGMMPKYEADQIKSHADQIRDGLGGFDTVQQYEAHQEAEALSGQKVEAALTALNYLIDDGKALDGPTLNKVGLGFAQRQELGFADLDDMKKQAAELRTKQATDNEARTYQIRGAEQAKAWKKDVESGRRGTLQRIEDLTSGAAAAESTAKLEKRLTYKEKLELGGENGLKTLRGAKFTKEGAIARAAKEGHDLTQLNIEPQKYQVASNPAGEKLASEISEGLKAMRPRAKANEQPAELTYKQKLELGGEYGLKDGQTVKARVEKAAEPATPETPKESPKQVEQPAPVEAESAKTEEPKESLGDALDRERAERYEQPSAAAEASEATPVEPSEILEPSTIEPVGEVEPAVQSLPEADELDIPDFMKDDTDGKTEAAADIGTKLDQAIDGGEINGENFITELQEVIKHGGTSISEIKDLYGVDDTEAAKMIELMQELGAIRTVADNTGSYGARINSFEELFGPEGSVAAVLSPADQARSIVESVHIEQTAEEKAAADQLYQDAVLTVVQEDFASASMLQRQLRIGFKQATELVQQMEDQGVVSPADEQGTRSVLKTVEEISEEQTDTDAEPVAESSQTTQELPVAESVAAEEPQADDQKPRLRDRARSAGKKLRNLVLEEDDGSDDDIEDVDDDAEAEEPKVPQSVDTPEDTDIDSDEHQNEDGNPADPEEDESAKPQSRRQRRKAAKKAKKEEKNSKEYFIDLKALSEAPVKRRKWPYEDISEQDALDAENATMRTEVQDYADKRKAEREALKAMKPEERKKLAAAQRKVEARSKKLMTAPKAPTPWTAEQKKALFAAPEGKHVNSLDAENAAMREEAAASLAEFRKLRSARTAKRVAQTLGEERRKRQANAVAATERAKNTIFNRDDEDESEVQAA